MGSGTLSAALCDANDTVSEQRVTIRLGKQRYELAITCPASVIPDETEPVGRVIKTKFIRLRQPVALGDYIDGWRVCWVGGWDRGKVTTRKLYDPWRWRLEEPEPRYRDAKNKESRAEYLRILRIFSALVLRYKLPEEYP